ncbi:MAG TPA: HAD-IIA family hydrolase [Angustibacter sp.]|nr:HAD-IIA family hydrolase [Angustibacter sp.]
MSEASTPGWGTTRGPLVDDHDVVLLDLDGVVYVGPQAVPGAGQTLGELRRRGVRVAFVTNNASRTPGQVADHLRSLSVDAGDDDVVTSAQAAARLLAADLPGGARVLVVGAEGLREAVRAVGLTPVEGVAADPVAVVQGFSPELSWAMLDEACVAVRQGLPWIATNVDSTLPTARGPAPGNGAFVEVVARTTGATPRVAGKPEPALLAAATERTGAQRPLFVGDRLDTDMAGARVAGMPGLHVLTGSSATVDLLAAGADRRPTYLAADLSGLLHEHRAPQVAPGHGRWRATGACGVQAGWQAGAGLRVDAAPPGDVELAVEVLRVGCAAVWAARDDGADVDLERARAALSPWTAPQGWDR